MPSLTRLRELEGRMCGARAKSTGLPCRSMKLGAGGRCKLHGGASTGARTPEGLERIKAALRARKGEKRGARAPRRTKEEMQLNYILR